jgi:predicted lipoprotein with Yx(FWY)xxD motif
VKTATRIVFWWVLSVFVGADASAELLTGRNGMTLYTFAKDSAGNSACSWYCIRLWPPAAADEREGPGFGAITREGGARQLTYEGRPLYYFIGDHGPGDANGDGIDQAWRVVTLPETGIAAHDTEAAALRCLGRR